MHTIVAFDVGVVGLVVEVVELELVVDVGGGTVETTVPSVVGALTVVVVTVVGGTLPQLSALPGRTGVPSSNRFAHHVPALFDQA